MSTIVFLMAMAVTSGPAPTIVRCQGPLPDELQWWEKREITPVAVALTKGANVKGFYKLLSYHLPRRQACSGKGLEACLPGIGAMRQGIDRYLREITPNPVDWWMDGTLCWVATIMVYGDNLKNLHAFIGKQAKKWPFVSARRIDAYFKRIVNDHGGPLIDRNWNCY